MAPVIVQKLLGHTDVSVTLNTYTSVYDQFKENEMDKVNQYYLNNSLFSDNITSRKQLDCENKTER